MAEQANLKVLIDAELKADFDELLRRKRTSLTAGVAAMVGWILRQDSLMQSVVLGQLEEADQREVVRLIAMKYGLIASDLEGKGGASNAVAGTIVPAGAAAVRKAGRPKEPRRDRQVREE